MITTPQSRELFRQALLRVLERNPARYGLPASAISHHAVLYGFPSPDAGDVLTELAYLEDKGLVAEVLKGISPENRAWRITAAGRDFVAQLANE